MNKRQPWVVKNHIADATGQREAVVIRVLSWDESVKIVGETTNVADVPWKRNIVWRISSSHRPITDRDREERYYELQKQ